MTTLGNLVTITILALEIRLILWLLGGVRQQWRALRNEWRRR